MNNNEKNNFFQNVIKLRQKTGAPIQLCREILKKEEYDFEKSLSHILETYVKSKSIASNEIQPGLSFNGVSFFKINSEQTLGIHLMVVCETEFVASNHEFKLNSLRIADRLIDHLVEHQGKKDYDYDFDKVKIGDVVLTDYIRSMILKFHEVINYRVKVFNVPDSTIKMLAYNHHDLKRCSMIMYTDLTYNETQNVDLENYQLGFVSDRFRLNENERIILDLCMDMLLLEYNNINEFLNSISTIRNEKISTIIKERLHINTIKKFTEIISE